MRPLSHPAISRRALLQQMGTGLGMIGLAGLLKDNALLGAEAKAANPLAPKPAHFAPRAKRIIHLFMNGGPSQVDTFDSKPTLEKYNGQKPPESIMIERNSTTLMRSPYKFSKHGNCGTEVSELYPHVAEC